MILPFVLILLSALLHVVWNLQGKTQGIGFLGYTVATWVGALALAPCLLIWPERVGLIPLPAWLWLVPSAILQGVFYYTLAKTFQRSPLSISYPITRALPVVLTTAWALVVGGRAAWQATPVLAFALVAMGCLVVGLPRWQGSLSGQRSGLLWAALTALLTTLYSIADDRTLRLIAAAAGCRTTCDALVLAAVLYLITALTMSLPYLVHPPAAALRRAIWEQRWSLLGLGLAINGGYLLVLVAMPMVPHIGWAVALRQISIPLGALAGFLWCREAITSPRLIGLAAVCGGLGWAACG